MSDDSRNVSGSWRGIFNYPREMPPNEFAAELREAVGAITGETSERSDSPEDSSPIIQAHLVGHRVGSLIHFTKHYEELRRAGDAIVYSGQISEDGDEISGRWVIPGAWSGSFLMVRSTRRAAETERKIAEPVL